MISVFDYEENVGLIFYLGFKSGVEVACEVVVVRVGFEVEEVGFGGSVFIRIRILIVHGRRRGGDEARIWEGQYAMRFVGGGVGNLIAGFFV